MRDRAFLERDRDGLALADDVGDEDHDPARLGALAPQPLDLGRHRLRLRALVGTAPHLHLAGLGRRRGRPRVQAGQRQCRLGGPPDGLRTAASGVELDRQLVVAGERVQPRRAGGAKAAQSAVGVAGHGQAGCPDLAGERRRREVELLGVVDQQVREGTRQFRLAGGHRDRVPDQIARITGAGRGQHPLVGAIDLGEFALGRRLPGVIRQRRGPGGVGVGIDELGFEAIDPPHEAGQEQVGAPTEVVVRQRQLVDALDQHRQPVAGAERGGQWIGPGTRASEDQCGELGRCEDMQLVVGELQPGLQPLAQRQRPPGGRHEDGEPLRARPLIDQPPEAMLDQPCLARPRGTADEQARPAIRDRIALSIAEPVEGAGAAVGAGEQVELPAPVASFVLGAHRLTA